nr:MAG TPA: hypothetical protein [Caudoviricetes sp.]
MLCSMGELEKHGFDEFEIHQYPKWVSLILKCADWITNKELDVALNYARKIAKNKPYRVFIKVKDSVGYKVLEVMDIIDLRLLDSKIKLTDNSFTIGKRLKVVVRG